MTDCFRGQVWEPYREPLHDDARGGELQRIPSLAGPPLSLDRHQEDIQLSEGVQIDSSAQLDTAPVLEARVGVVRETAEQCSHWGVWDPQYSTGLYEYWDTGVEWDSMGSTV